MHKYTNYLQCSKLVLYLQGNKYIEMEKIQVVSIHAANFGPISNLKADFALGDVLIVIGANESGKSTFVEGFFNVLRQKFPKIPVKKGSKSGGLSVKFSDGCEATYMAEMEGETLISETFTVKDPEGKRMGQATAKQYLSQLIGNYGGGFSISEFATTTAPKERRLMLQKLTLQSGSDLTAIDKAAANYAAKMEDRKEAGRLRDAQKNRVTPFDEVLAEKELVSATALATERLDIDGHNAKYDRAKLAADELKPKTDQTLVIQKHAQELVDLKISTDEKIKARNERLAAEIERITKECATDIEAIRDDLKRGGIHLSDKMDEIAKDESAAKERLETANKWLNDPANAPKSTEAIDKQLSELSDTNEAISAAKRMKAEQAKLDELESDYQSKNDAVAKADAARKAAIANCKLPANLTFAEDGDNLLYNGFPLEKQSKARCTMIAIELQLSQMGELGFITADLSHLDADHLEECVGLLRANGLQAAIEISPRKKSENELHIEIFEDYAGIPKPERPETEQPKTLFPEN